MSKTDTPYRHMLTDALAFSSASHSPCVGVCDHSASQDCSGCHRPHDEVEGWREADPDIRLQRWHELPKSLASAGIKTMRLPLSQEAILELAHKRLHDGGSWMLGGSRFHAATDRHLEGLSATNADQSVTITLASDIKMRAVLWAPAGHRLDEDMAQLPIALVTPRIRIERQEGWHQRPQSGGYTNTLYLSELMRISANPDARDATSIKMESVIAEAEIQMRDHPAPDFGKMADMPNGLVLPESYVLGLMLLSPATVIS